MTTIYRPNNKIRSTEVSAGSVIQVVSTYKNDTFSATSYPPTFTDITGMSVTITPSSSSNKIFITGVICAGNTGDVSMGLRILRGSTEIFPSASDASYYSAVRSYCNNNNDTTRQVSFSFYDSPATTSATTYKIQGTGQSGEAWYINRSKNDYTTAQQTYSHRCASTITAMEIKG
jgi:hypothetical protein